MSNPNSYAQLGLDLEALSARVYALRRQHFPRQTERAAAAKLHEEAGELVDSLGRSSTEAADVLITLLGWCHASGVTVDGLVALGHSKMFVNESRDWKLLPDGRAKHVAIQD